MSANSVNTKNMRRGPFGRMSPIAIILVMMIALTFSPYWVYASIRDMKVYHSEPVPITDTERNINNRVYLTPDEMYKPFAASKFYSRVTDYLCLSEYNGKYIVLKFDKNDWQALGYDNPLDEGEAESAYKMQSVDTYVGTLADIDDNTLNAVIEYYNAYIGEGLTSDNYTDTIAPQILVVNDNSLINSLWNGLIIGLLVFLISIFTIYRNVKKILAARRDRKASQ